MDHETKVGVPGVCVGVMLCVPVKEVEGVMDGVGVFVGVIDEDGVTDGVAVYVGEGVMELVGDGVEVSVVVVEGVGVLDGVSEDVGVGVSVVVVVGVGVGVADATHVFTAAYSTPSVVPLLPTPQSGLAAVSFRCQALFELPHVQEIELAVELASGGQLVQVSAAPTAMAPFTWLAKVLALQVHVVWPASEEAPVVQTTHCSAAPVALLAA